MRRKERLCACVCVCAVCVLCCLDLNVNNVYKYDEINMNHGSWHICDIESNCIRICITKQEK